MSGVKWGKLGDYIKKLPITIEDRLDRPRRIAWLMGCTEGARRGEVLRHRHVPLPRHTKVGA